jgi:hypothetical protein
VSEPILVAIIAASAPTVAVAVGWFLTRVKLDQVHVLVNSRLDEALKRIDELEKRLEIPPEDKY